VTDFADAPLPVIWPRVAEGTADIRDIEQAVADLYVRLRPSVVWYVRAMTRVPCDPEDLAQMAFLRLFDALRSRTPVENPRAWIFRVVHNLLVDRVRRAGKERDAYEEWGTAQATVTRSSPEDALIQQQQIHGALRHVNARERACLLLRVRGLSYSEIADVIGTTPKTVSVYLARGLQKVARKHGSED
jgi:RNA polymerase sigma-70 factor, ECF subfamily